MTNTSTSDRRASHQRAGRGDLSGPLVGGLVGAVQLSRRDLLRWAALVAGTLGASQLLAACGADPDGAAGGPGRQAPAGSLRALVADVPQVSLLAAQSQLPPGRTRFSFGLAGPTNELVEGATPELWLARDQTSKAIGPFPARWMELKAYDKTRDRSPRSTLNGFYVAEVDVPSPGNWLGVAMIDVASQRAAGQGLVKVSARVPAQIGTRARSGSSPVATSPTAIAKICTREPVCPMHYVSLDQALRSGKPTVLSFATPLLCSSRMCGPVIDELMVAFENVGKETANFIHSEIYPQRDTAKPAPLYAAWELQSEPWLVVIDRGGIIRARAEGPVNASEIAAFVQAVQ
ncbi:MAG TPA: hypothetical protein VE776_08600 [Actinomycetota bacterium]|jgi:hypothetical protein|nr:hypothetical protein [Actinomycetota bacterium]